MDEIYLSLVSRETAYKFTSSTGSWPFKWLLSRLIPDSFHGRIGSSLSMVKQRQGHILLLSVVCSMVGCSILLAHDLSANARFFGWTRLFFSVAVFSGWITFLMESFKPFHGVSTFVNVAALSLTQVGTPLACVRLCSCRRTRRPRHRCSARL